jgi:hypothetical protein
MVEGSGADAVVVQGIEAGGHQGSFMYPSSSSQSKLVLAWVVVIRCIVQALFLTCVEPLNCLVLVRLSSFGFLILCVFCPNPNPQQALTTKTQSQLVCTQN